MRYSDGLIDVSIKKDEDGGELFHLFRMFGKGRVIPDAESGERLRRCLKIYYIFLIPLIFLIAVSFQLEIHHWIK